MKMSGEETIAAPREIVWKAMNDTAVLMKCIPGCESITRHSATEMEARVVIKVGPVKAGFTGVVKLSDMDPPNGYRIAGEGKGGLAGFATGGADVRLESVAGGTLLKYDVDAQVGGKLAILGSRLIDSPANSLATQFFEKFAAAATAMVIALSGSFGRFKPVTTVSQNVTFMRPIAEQDVLVDARVIRLGKTLAFGEITLRGAKDARVAAQATTTYAILA